MKAQRQLCLTPSPCSYHYDKSSPLKEVQPAESQGSSQSQRSGTLRMPSVRDEGRRHRRTEGDIPEGCREEMNWQDGPIKAEGEPAQAKVERWGSREGAGKRGESTWTPETPVGGSPLQGASRGGRRSLGWVCDGLRVSRAAVGTEPSAPYLSHRGALGKKQRSSDQEAEPSHPAHP